MAQAIQAGVDGPNRGGDFNAVHYDVGEDESKRKANGGAAIFFLRSTRK